MTITAEWNRKQAQMRSAIIDPARFEEAMAICLELHSTVHRAAVSDAGVPTPMDLLWENLSRTAFVTMPTKRDATVAWDIWHITRIEDIAANILIARGLQVLDGVWTGRLGTAVTDTGNAMSDEEIVSLSRELDIGALRDYRDAVGRRTRQIISALSPADLRRRVNPEDKARILDEGCVTQQEKSVWLVDFWGRKNIAGLLLMPVTRHQSGHLKDAIRLKGRIKRPDRP